MALIDQLVETSIPIIDSALIFLRLFFSALSLLDLGAVKFPPQADVVNGQHFDFIVVGAGSAGCVVARRLTENADCKVLLIEAGDIPSVQVAIPGLLPFVEYSYQDWNYTTEDNGRTGQSYRTKANHMTRGKMLGGSSGANFMFYVRGPPGDYDFWEESGCDGWGWHQVFKYFFKSEGLNDKEIKNGPTGILHNTKGPLGVTRPTWKTRTAKLLAAFKENGHEILNDNNGFVVQGYALPQYTINHGVRQTTSISFLSPVRNRTNLFLLKKTYVRRVLFNDDKRAIGVEVKDSAGLIKQFYADKEVVLSAGAINTPQLLMLSGVGPEEHLRSLNIPVIYNSPYVGKNLQDHTIVPLSLTGEKDTLVDTASATLEYLLKLNELGTPVIIGQVAMDRTKPNVDYQSYSLPVPRKSLLVPLETYYLFGMDKEIAASATEANLDRECVITLICLQHPKSTGEILLRSNDFEDKPKIYTNYYSDPQDLEDHATYIQDYLTVLDTSYFKLAGGQVVNYNITNCKQFEFNTHEYWKCHCLELSTTLWHPCGTCKMGIDEEAVVTPRLKFNGIEGLRIVDASVIPFIPGGNINAPTIMIGEMGSDFIKQDNGYPWQPPQ